MGKLILGVGIGMMLVVILIVGWLILTPAPYTPVCPSAILNQAASLAPTPHWHPETDLRIPHSAS